MAWIETLFAKLVRIRDAGDVYHNASGLRFKIRISTPDALIVDEVYGSYLPLIEGIDLSGATVVDLTDSSD